MTRIARYSKALLAVIVFLTSGMCVAMGQSEQGAPSSQAALPAAPASCAPGAACITSILPNPAVPGDPVVINGTNFGSPQGSVTFGGIRADIKDWSPTTVNLTLPNLPGGAANAVVTPNVGNASPAFAFSAVTAVSITLNPSLIRPANGKLPASISLGVLEDNCDDKRGLDLSQGGSAPYAVAVTGSGLSATGKPKVGKCSITTTLTIDPNTPVGDYQVSLLNKDQKIVGSARMSIMDSTAGPIPPGIAPQVDVIWEVMSQKNCGDVFGTRVAASDYCIQIKIGNDSGYAIQLAGIGFKTKLNGISGSPDVTIANSSYASTRAVLQNQQAYSGRNIVYHGLQSVGLIMAAFIPFFGTQHANGTINNARNHWSTLSSIVSGPVVKGFDTVWPDPAIAQLTNLDDQSFRDSMVIQNNTQIQTVVFVEKQALTYQLKKLYQDSPNLRTDPNTSNNTDNGNPSDSPSPNKTGTTDASGTGGGQTSAGKSKLSSKEALNVSTVDNSRNSRRPFFPRAGRFNPLSVKLALGSVVIVGQQIQYLQRIQIQSNAAPATTSVPTINSITPTCAAVGDSITLAGANFGAAQNDSSVKFGDTPVTNIQATDWSDKSIKLTVPSVALGPVNIVVTVAGKDSAPAAFGVGTKGAPCIANISPGTGAPNDSVTITGSGFGTSVGPITFGGVATTPITASNWSDTSIKSVTVPSVGPSTVQVVVTANKTATAPFNFTMKCPSTGPCITTLSLPSGTVGTSVAITGQNFGTSQGTSTLTFNGTPAKPKLATDWTDNLITVPVPPGAKTGPIVITVGPTKSPQVNFTVQ